MRYVIRIRYRINHANDADNERTNVNGDWDKNNEIIN